MTKLLNTDQEVLDTNGKWLAALMLISNLGSSLLEMNKNKDLGFKLSVLNPYEDALRELGILLNIKSINDEEYSENIDLYFSIKVEAISKGTIDEIVADIISTESKDNVFPKEVTYD